MSLFDIFTKQAAPATAAASTTNTAATNPTVPSTATVPAQMDANGNPVAKSPLDQYGTLWENDPNKPKPMEQFAFNADQGKLLEAARQVDFTKMLTPELQKRIQAGGADGMNAVMEAMNSTAQASYAQSALASSKIAEAANRAAEDRMMAMLPDILRKHSVQNSVRETNPLATDPAMAPLISALQTQIQSKYPTATPTEVSSHVNDFLNAAADRITGARPKPQDKSARPAMDWDLFMQGQ